MNYIIKNNQNLIIKFNIIIFILILFYKINLVSKIPITGDELNSILVYSSNIKTLFLKNFPGNVTIFHFIGLLFSKFFGYELIVFRTVAFLFFALSIVLIYKISLNYITVLLAFMLVLSSNLLLYLGLYIGYHFSSFLFLLVYLLIKLDYNKNLNLILLLLFIQVYNHLVNLYLALPLCLCLFLFCDKKKFIKSFIIYFFFPILVFYSLSILLTGLSEIKIINTNISFVFQTLLENFTLIIEKGFNRIFFYEAYQNANSFNLVSLLKSLYNFDKMFLILLTIYILISLLNLKKNKNLFFSYTGLFHLLFFFLINKDPAPRIFTGFALFYFISIVDNYYFFLKKIDKNLILILFQLILINYLIFYFQYSKVLYQSIYYNDITFKEDKVSVLILKKNCKLITFNRFNELQKRNFYFNYLNYCKKEFNLNEFLTYYRTK